MAELQDEYGELAAVEESISKVERVPGLHRCWDVEQLLDQSSVLIIEPGGKLEDGTEVFQVLRCALRTTEARKQTGTQAHN